MINIYLDDQPLAVAQDTSIGLTLGISQIEDPTSATSSASKTIKIPMTERNVAVFRHCEEILSPDIFNNAEHVARVEQDGIELIKGKAYLNGIDRYRDGTGYYKLQIVGDEFDWVQRIRDKAMNELNDAEKISQFARYANLTDAQRANAFFALLDHGCWWQEVGDETVRRNWATYADLMPFVSIRAILNEIFKGYDIVIDKSIADAVELLYVTGQFKKSDNASVLAEDNDFKVTTELLNAEKEEKDGKEVDLPIKGTITSDAAPVDLKAFDTIDEDDNGRITITDTGTKKKPNIRASFTPSEECVASFNVKIGYQTTLAWEEKMLNATLKNGQLVGDLVSTRPFPIFADTVTFGVDPLVKFRYTDSKEWAERELLTDGEDIIAYPATISDYDDLIGFSLKDTTLFYIEVSQPALFKSAGFYKLVDGGTDNTSGTIQHFYTRTTDFVSKKMFVRAGWQPNKTHKFTQGGVSVKITTKIRLALEDNDGTVYFINKNGLLVPINAGADETRSVVLMGTVKVWGMSDQLFTFENTAPSTALSIYPVEPYVLQASVEASEASVLSESVPAYNSAGNFIGYGEDETNGKLTVYTTNKCEVSPKFDNVVRYGTNVSINDIAGDASAVDMLKAVMQLFNLRIYTNPDKNLVYLTPFSAFYRDDIVDWSNRIALDKGITVSSIGDNVGNKLTLSYQDGSAPVSEYNERHKTPLFSYSVDLANKTSDSEKEVQNSVFNPPIAERASVIFEADKPTGDAADTSAWILNTASKGTKDTIDNIDYELPRTLVQLHKVQNPFNGTLSMAVAGIGCYGVLDGYAQPDMEVLQTLDFSGRIGLHRYYDKQVTIWNEAKQIVCYCHLLPQEVESLRKPDMSIVDFRSKFKIRLFGEELLCRLQSVDNYEPSSATCKCTFIYHPQI